MSPRITARKVSLAAVALFVAAGQFVTGSGPAAGAVPTNCVADAPALGATAAQTPVCFVRFDDAIAYATGGKIHLADAATPRAVTDTEMSGATAATASPNTVYVLSIDYKDASFGGATFTWTQGSPCGIFSSATMPSGWNDAVSSVVAFNGCAVSLFQNISWGGTRFAIGVNGSASSMGTFNDQASSEKWCPTYPC